MSPTPQPDHQQQIRHFQSINAANLTTIINILLTLSVGVTAFAVNVLINTKGPVGHAASIWLIASFVMLFGATSCGIAILFTRLEDYRRTIQGAAMMRDNPGEIKDIELIRRAKSLKKSADRLNRTTNILIYVLPALFFLGFVCLSIAVFIIHGSKLN